MARGAFTSCSSMTGRPPSREERALWRAAMRELAPLAQTAAGETASPTEPPPPRARSAPPRPAPARHLPDLTPDVAPGLDRRNARRLRRGEMPVEARLDLHGMTQQQAHRALGEFLAHAEAAGRRCVLLITGKSGVLRSAAPRWLNEPTARARLVAVAPAHPKDGGAGALYFLLRRRR
jgi:DNA-nicking Smr family endonuclease